MKILHLTQNIRWKKYTIAQKEKELIEWWKPVSLEITTEKVNLKLQWENYTAPDGRVFKGLKKDWFEKTIANPALLRGFDAVMITIPTKEWADTRVEGWHSYFNIGIHGIQILGRENARYNFNGIVYEGDQWFNIARHELAHAMYAQLRRKDNTHYWWEKGRLEEVRKELGTTWTSNPIVLAVRRVLNQFMQPFTSEPRVVTLKRLSDNGVQTVGQISYKDFTAHTLELAWKDNRKNVSAIPKGTYTCKFTMSPRFKMMTYEVLNVPNRSGIRIHRGNYHTQINGCILMGDSLIDINRDGQLDVTNSVKTLARFEELMGQKEFVLVVE